MYKSLISRLRLGIQSLPAGRPLAEHYVKRTASPKPGSLISSRAFSSPPNALRSHFFTAKRPQRPSMDKLGILRRTYASSSEWHTRYLSTQRVVLGIIGLNTAVFGAWQYAQSTHDNRVEKFLNDNALCSWANINSKRYWTLITSAFSHYNTTHFLFNMISLNAFGSVVAMAAVGVPHVISLTICSAIASSTAFLYWRKRTATSKGGRIWGPNAHHLPTMAQAALGASGVVTGFSAAATCLMPFARMGFMFIPVAMPMWVMTGVYLGVDLYLLGSNDNVGHDAHIGGALCGMLYYAVFLRKFGGISSMLRLRR